MELKQTRTVCLGQHNRAFSVLEYLGLYFHNTAKIIDRYVNHVDHWLYAQ